MRLVEKKNLDFPIFSRIVSFYNFPDNLVRATAYNTVLTILNSGLIREERWTGNGVIG